MADNSKVVDVLEKLIEYARDGQNGWRDGAEHVKNQELKRWMEQVSLQRAKMAGEIENEAIRLGKSDVDRSGSIEGAIHRGWADLKSNLGGGDDAILSSMQFGDEYAINGYQKYLNEKSFPEEIREIMQNHLQQLRSALERVKVLRAQHKAA